MDAMQILAPDADGLQRAVALLRGGELVAFPTETVYGLGADAFDSGAVTGLLAAKGRGRDMPVGVLVGSWHTIEGLVYTVPHSARELIRAFWPGALSLVVQQAPSLQWDLGDARGTVMLRMPLHPVAIELLREVGPMAVSSANISGRPAATTAEEAQTTKLMALNQGFYNLFLAVVTVLAVIAAVPSGASATLSFDSGVACTPNPPTGLKVSKGS